jgi:hypothetical protein
VFVLKTPIRAVGGVQVYSKLSLAIVNTVDFSLKITKKSRPALLIMKCHIPTANVKGA